MKKWDETFAQNQFDSFAEIEKVIPQLTMFEKVVQLSRKVKPSDNAKERMIKMFDKTDNVVDIICYFAKTFKKEEESTGDSKSIFGSALKVPQYRVYMDPQTQEKKFIG